MAASITTVPTLYTAKSIVNDQSATTHWDGADANVLQSPLQLLTQNVPRTQSVALGSAGTTTFAPTWDQETPTNVLMMGKNATGGGMVYAGGPYLRVTVLSANQITVVHGNGPAGVTAYATVFYR